LAAIVSKIRQKRHDQEDFAERALSVSSGAIFRTISESLILEYSGHTDECSSGVAER
jgi:hypothetical protein